MKGFPSLFLAHVKDSNGNMQLPSKSAHIRQHFNNQTYNKTYRPIKQYLPPTEPSDSKKYPYGIMNVTRTILYIASETGFIIISNVTDPSNNPSDTGGFWSCDVAINLLFDFYNDNTPDKRRVGWKMMKKLSPSVNWWHLAALRGEPVTLRAIMNWMNPPDFNIPLERNAPAIDLERYPTPLD